MRALITTCLLIVIPAATQCRVEDMYEVVAGNSEFATALYENLAAADDGNIIVSPYSVSTVMALAYVGAGSQTAAEIRSTFHFPSRDATTHSGFASLMKRIISVDGTYELHVANRVWGDSALELSPRYEKHSQRFYGASLEKVDFHLRPEDARDEINLWVASQTNEMITELMPKGSIDYGTQLVITNAIYFKSAWAARFDADQTKPAPFRTLAGNTPQRDFMNITGQFGYLDEGNVQVLRLPYADGRLAMIVALPRDPAAISTLDTSLAGAIEAWTGQLPKSVRRVRVSIPRFKMGRSIELSNVLAGMGMPRAFGVLADFRGIANEQLFIQNVVHEAVIEVIEEGTEASAATSLSVSLKSGIVHDEPATFIADHPFIFLIHDSETGSILFMGRVMNPAPPDN